MTLESSNQQPEKVFRNKTEYRIIKAEIRKFAQIALRFPQSNQPEFIKLYFLDRLVDQGVTDDMLLYFSDNHFNLELANNYYSLRENISLSSKTQNLNTQLSQFY